MNPVKANFDCPHCGQPTSHIIFASCSRHLVNCPTCKKHITLYTETVFRLAKVEAS